MYLDTDVILAVLKPDDWLQSAVRQANLEDPKTSVITAVEIQLVMFEEWSRSDLADVHHTIEAEGIEVLPLTVETFQAGAELLPTYHALNVFDAIHVGQAMMLSEPLVSTDTLYPTIETINHLDPRDI